MKRITVQLSLLLAIILIQVSCSKDKDIKAKIEMDEEHLTPCPDNAHCEYLFTENADIDDGVFVLRGGAYRLFWGSIEARGTNSRIYVKAPMQGKTFFLDKMAILGGRVNLVSTCAACLQAPLKPVDGYVKGANLTPDKPADQTKWLLEAQLILQIEANPAIKDTLYVKQYFYPNFIYN